MVSLASLREVGRTAAAQSGPKLRVIDQRSLRQRAIRRGVYVTVCVLLATALFAVAFLQAELVQGQQVLDQNRLALRQAEAERARLTHEVDIASSPESIVARATAMGMVRAADPIYFTAIMVPAAATPAPNDSLPGSDPAVAIAVEPAAGAVVEGP
jgi:cell division protein FtsL